MYDQNILPEITIKFKPGNILRKKLFSSRDSVEILRQMFDSDTLEFTECFIAIMINSANETIGWYKASTGGITATIADPRQIFLVALQSAATAMILSHNHPSGNLKPSQQDIKLTSRMVEIGKLMDIRVIDHVIITTDSYYSFADDGQLI